MVIHYYLKTAPAAAPAAEAAVAPDSAAVPVSLNAQMRRLMPRALTSRSPTLPANQFVFWSRPHTPA